MISEYDILDDTDDFFYTRAIGTVYLSCGRRLEIWRTSSGPPSDQDDDVKLSYRNKSDFVATDIWMSGMSGDVVRSDLIPALIVFREERLRSETSWDFRCFSGGPAMTMYLEKLILEKLKSVGVYVE